MPMKNNRFLLRYDLNMQAESKRAEIMIYSQITSRKYKPDDPEITAIDFDKMLKNAKSEGATKLHLRINSPGGNVYQAVAMRAMLLGGGFDEVTAGIEGLCASAATLLTSIPGMKVTIAEGSSFMIHNPSTIMWGTAADLRHEADVLEKMEKDFHGIYASRTGKSEDDIKAMMDKETWMTAKEAVEAGFCDALLDAPQAAACVTEEQLETMQAMYLHMPQMTAKPSEPTTPPTVSNTGAGVTTEPVPENTNPPKEEMNMDPKDITMEQLRTENPDLLAQVVAAERQRVQDIDDLTMPGYEQMAAEAKRNGTSAMDFQKAVVKAQREKGPAFMAARQQEVAPAAQVMGGEPSDPKTDADELAAYVKEMTAYAAQAAENESMY